MAGISSLAKILDVRESEKQTAHKSYIKSQYAFEEVATKLYQMLKKKEKAEEAYDMYIESPTSLEQIKEQLTYIEKLNEHITLLQSQVQRVRNEMERKQALLTDAHVEVKKYETIINRRKEQKIENETRKENIFMDEISINQYLSHKNR